MFSFVQSLSSYVFQFLPPVSFSVVLGRVRLGRQSGRLVRVARGSFNPLGVFSYYYLFVRIFVATGISLVFGCDLF